MNNQEAELLLSILNQSPVIKHVLERAPQLPTPNWYLGAGCLTQTVWNYYHGYALDAHIKDCDLVYYDEDLSQDKEEWVVEQGNILFRDCSIKMDIVNQARVHLWYEETFEYPIQPYTSIEHAISTWPTTATSIALTYGPDKEGIQIIAPYGLTDALSLVVRANKVQITPEIYQKKVDRWSKVWPKLKVIPW